MKYLVGLLIVLLLGTNAFWVYALIDEAITCMYSDASFETTNKLYAQSLALANLNVIGMTVDDAKQLIGSDIYGLDPFEKDGCLNVGDLCLRYDTSRVIVEVTEGPG